MKRVLLWSLLGVMALFFGMTTLVLLRADPEGLPAPDPAMPIHLADGTTRPLFEVVQAAREGTPLPYPQARKFPTDPSLTPEEAAEHQRMMEVAAESVQKAIREVEGTVFHLAEVARHEGRLDEAQALYLSVPEDDPRYGRARRRLAWDVLTKGKNQPRLAVAYANDSVRADPLEGNSWQDLVRVYGATLGIDVD